MVRSYHRAISRWSFAIFLFVLWMFFMALKSANATNFAMWRPCLTGNNSCIDAISIHNSNPNSVTPTPLVTGDVCTVKTSDGIVYDYRYDADSALSVSSPNIIKPIDNSGNGRWLLMGARFTSISAEQYYSLANDGGKYIDLSNYSSLTSVPNNGRISWYNSEFKLGDGTSWDNDYLVRFKRPDIYNGTVTNIKSTNYTIGSDNISESYGGLIYATAAETITLPIGSIGMSVTVITVGDVSVNLKPNVYNSVNDQIILDGAYLTAGHKATNTSLTGDVISCAYYNANGGSNIWYCGSGTTQGAHWLDGGL